MPPALPLDSRRPRLARFCAAGLLALLLAVLLAADAPGARADDEPTRVPHGHHLDLQADRTTHDFGFVKQDDVRKTTFVYTNRGEQPVAGIQARGECGCNVVAVSKESLEPGESGELEVEFNTYTLGGRLQKHVRVVTDDPRRGELMFTLDIAIVAGLVVRPPSVSYRDVAHGSKPTQSFTLRWYEGQGEPFEVTSVTVPGFEEDFVATVKPWTDPKDAKARGWEIEMQLVRELPIGMFSAEVLVRTTHAERPRLTLPLSANVVGRIWMQSRAFSFGAVRLPTDKASSIKLKPYAEGVKLEKLRAVARLGKVVVEVIPDPYMAEIGMWKLIARIAPDAPQGSLEDEVIELHTGVPGEEIVLLSVRGHVLAPKADDDGR
ncbi:MAG: DUF1573 domain-containing protein [Planctomycetota bacterium]|nr:DUF1573 domain-containing protein [Planctomycetota bacterium]